MVKLTNPLMSGDARGKFGNKIIFTRGGQARRYFKPRNPNTPAQQAVREAFKEFSVPGLTQEQADLLYAAILHLHDDRYLQELPAHEHENYVDSAGLVVAGAVAWQAVTTFYNSWQNYGGGEPVASYGLDGFGRLWFKGTIKAGSVFTKAFTLAEGWRPQEKKTLLCISSTFPNLSYFDVMTNGDVIPSAEAPAFFVLMGQTPLL